LPLSKKQFYVELRKFAIDHLVFQDIGSLASDF